MIDDSQFAPTSHSAGQLSSGLRSTSHLSRTQFGLSLEGSATYINAEVVPEPQPVIVLLWPALLLATAARARRRGDAH
jgi:hypothetical protein